KILKQPKKYFRAFVYCLVHLKTMVVHFDLGNDSFSRILELCNSPDTEDGAVTPTSRTDARPKKPRRHTTGSSKEAQEDLLIAKHFSTEMQQNGGKVVNELGQEIDPNSTLGRKQLIGMLKQRYGQDIENYRSSISPGEKERMKRERQMERDRRHEQRLKHGLDNDDVDHRYIKTNPVIHTNGIGHHRRHSGGSAASATSEGSDGSAFGSSPQVRRTTITKSSTTVHNSSSRHQSSDDEQGYYHRQIPTSSQTPKSKTPSKEVVFLQFHDEMRRVNLPSSVSSIDAIKVLFVNAFPGKVSMPDFEMNEKSIYIKDLETGVFFQLDDVRDVLNRSFLKVHEQNKPLSEEPPHQQQPNNDIHSFSESEANDLQRYHSSSNNHQQKQSTKINYAESLQDADLSAPRMRTRTNSGSSLRSDNVLTRPTHMQNSATSSYTYVSDDGNSRVQHSNESSAINHHAPATKKSTSSSTNITPSTSAVQSTHSINSSTSYNAAPSSNLHQHKLEKERSMSDSSSVQDQLDDLTELLKTALNDEQNTHNAQQPHDDLFHAQYGDAKNPGKLNPTFVDDLQVKMQSAAKKNQALPKHFQPTIIVKAQQEAQHRSDVTEDFNERKVSSSGTTNNSPHEPQHQKLNKSKSVRVTVRSNAAKTNAIADEKRARDDMSLTHQHKPRVTEGFFTPPNKQSYVEHKQTTKTVMQNGSINLHPAVSTAAEPTIDFDMSELDDLMNYDPNSSPAPVKKKISETKNTTEVASDLLDQLQSLEDEMKINFSSIEDCVQESLRSSNSSVNSKSSGMYATVQKKTPTTSVSSVPETPPSPRKPHANTVSFDMHSEAEAEIAKLRAMTINGPSAPTSNNSPSLRTKARPLENLSISASSSFSDHTDGVFTTSGSRKSSSSSSAKSPTRKMCQRPSVTAPDFVELETAANLVRENIADLRKDLSTLRKMHVDNTRHFKNDIQKKLLEFRKKASKVDDTLQNRMDRNNNNIFANDHPVREQRHRLTNDQGDYNKKTSSTEYRLQTLEGVMENVRLEVVNKKRVDDPNKLLEFEEEIINITRSLTDVRNKYLGISDTMKRVMHLETEIILKEETFLKEEPEKLDTLIERCKTLSGTLQTLQKLAKMQSEVATSRKPSSNQNRQRNPTHSSPDYQEIDDVNHNNMQRGVRFHR
uniref:Actin interacting protein 3-like C-terminal domain-containing protein n=2 Tax=Clytia hemisphaerica TaxID=252671 RepID=A0A7M5WRC5_9CNID